MSFNFFNIFLFFSTESFSVIDEVSWKKTIQQIRSEGKTEIVTRRLDSFLL